MKIYFLPLCLVVLILAACTDPELSQITAGKNLDLTKTPGTVTNKTTVILKGDQEHTKNLIGAPCNNLYIRLPNNAQDTVFSCVSEENFNAVSVHDSLPIKAFATTKFLSTVTGLIKEKKFEPDSERWYIVVWDHEKYRLYRVAPELYYKLDMHQRLPLELE